MNTWSRWLIAVLVVACSPPTSSQVAPTSDVQEAEARRPNVGATSTAGSFTCGSLTVNFGSGIPPDASLSNQTDADCYAWQEFIALNWPASGQDFGAPGDLSAVQWQGYMDAHQVFQLDAVPPPPWGTPPQITGDCLSEAKLTDDQARRVHPLVNATKFSSEFLDGSDRAEAFPSGGAPAWLGDVTSNNVWYEVRLNQDEYNFIVQNEFYDAQKQVAFYTSQNPVTTPLQLPAGCNGSSPSCPQAQTGAIELKAGWMEVLNPGDAKWNAYKLTSAVVVDPPTQKCRQITVALVAFHIIHKTQSQPTWIWATFEHEDNAPNAGGSTPQPWNFNNPECTTTTIQVPAACRYNGQASVTTTCTPNTPPQYDIGAGCPDATPIQVIRVNPIDTTATQVNTTAQAAIKELRSDSVWQNYILVNVVWSTNPPVIPPACSAGSPGCQGVTTPQLTQSLNPGGAVANTVLETYIQDHASSNPFQKSNCILCHQYATVAGDSSTPYASDFSFLLGDAQSPPGAAGKAKSTKPSLRGMKTNKIRRIFR